MVLGVLGVLTGLGGCRPSEPTEAVVSARSPIGFSMWQSRFATEASPELRQSLEAALQEIRLKVMGDREASGGEAIDAALREKIDGRPVREVLQRGWESRLHRLVPEHAALKDVITLNATLQTRPGDVASENHLVEVYRKQTARLEALAREIEAAERALAPLVKRTGRRLLPPPPGSADAKAQQSLPKSRIRT